MKPFESIQAKVSEQNPPNDHVMFKGYSQIQASSVYGIKEYMFS